MNCSKCNNETTKWQLKFYSGICALCYIRRPEATRPVVGQWSRYQKAELHAHAKDVLQPLKKDGTISKEFVQAHGTKSISKELGINSRVIRQQVDKPTKTVSELRYG